MTTFWIVTAAIGAVWLFLVLWIWCIVRSGSMLDKRTVHHYRRPRP